jgi:asparagine synthase (glutamine-hydrolysing)
MVGIFTNSPDAAWIQRQLEEHSFRGPDHTKTSTVTPKLTMGANRLAMVDRHPRSNQPMKSQLTDSTITFNGEIYNFRQLRNNLVSEGIDFVTESDTEVLLLGLENHGIEFLKNVNGMYAFAYFDAIKKKLIFGRDHLGKKPLYLRISSESIAWSSNLSSFEEPENQLSSKALGCYLRFGYVIDPLTTNVDIQSVLPGQTIEIDLESGESIKNVITQNRCRKVKSLRQTLLEAVEARIYKEDLLGISMSGGLDSTIIALMSKELGLNVRSYTAKWSDADKSKYNDDADAAKEISELLGIEHYEVEMMKASELPKKIRQYVTAMEEPNNNPTGISMMDLYSKISSDGIRLTLTGDGADELFSGYERYKKAAYIPKFLNLKTKAWIDPARTKTGALANRLVSAQFNDSNYSFWSSWHNLFNSAEIDELAGGKYCDSAWELFQQMQPRESSNLSSMLQNQDLQIWISMESNRRLDRISMFHSIEARSPFLDDEVVEYALRTRNQKYLSKSEIFKREFPELSTLPVMSRKSGFVSPIGHWLRGNPEFVNEQIGYLNKYLGFNMAFMQSLSESPRLGNFESMKKLWALLILASWHDIYVRK